MLCRRVGLREGCCRTPLGEIEGECFSRLFRAQCPPFGVEVIAPSVQPRGSGLRARPWGAGGGDAPVSGVPPPGVGGSGGREVGVLGLTAGSRITSGGIRRYSESSQESARMTMTQRLLAQTLVEAGQSRRETHQTLCQGSTGLPSPSPFFPPPQPPPRLPLSSSFLPTTLPLRPHPQHWLGCNIAWFGRAAPYSYQRRGKAN